jgi:hypothetical protein
MPATLKNRVVGIVKHCSRRLFKHLQHGNGSEGIFQTADVLDELLHGSG